MFKPKKLLKVVSILLIIFGILGIISVPALYFIMQSLEEVPGITKQMLDQVASLFTPLNLFWSLLPSCLLVAAGILGVMGKSFNACLILMIIYTLILIMNQISSLSTTGFSVTIIINYILPVLYFWGLYQSKES